MAANKKDYNRNYMRERKVEVYPATKDLAFIKQMQLEKPGMSKSAVAAHLISEGIKRVMSKNNY